MKVLHLDYRPATAGGGLRLQSRLQGSSSQTLQDRYSQWREFGLAEQGIAVATKVSLVLRVSTRLSELLHKLCGEIRESDSVTELLAEGYAYTSNDSRILYDLCLAVDAFYFEFRSCYEVLGQYVKSFCEHILERRTSEKELLDVLLDSGLDTQWVVHLRENRKLFFHYTAPWIALHIHEEDPLTCSLVVMKENLKKFDEPEKFITQEEMVAASKGLQGAVNAVFDWMGTLVTEFEEAERGTLPN